MKDDPSSEDGRMILLANYVGRSGVPKTVELLKAKADGLRAMIEGIKLVEDDPEVHSVGRSSWPNLIGELQLDAAVMDGNTRRTGAVGALRGFRYPVEVAHAVMLRLDHEILVGVGAERFAAEIGAERCKNETDYSMQSWNDHLQTVLAEGQQKRFPEVRLLDIQGVSRDPERTFDTTVFLSIDHTGRIASATSTSGWPWKYPGRLGDSPIIGAGSYADSRYGACACTHLGEMAIRSGTARIVVLYLQLGYALRDAVREAARDLADLKTGCLGEVVIHAINNRGDHFVLGVYSETPARYWVWDDSMAAPEIREAEVFQST
jgi:isoaspartyl peptidase/L-asparaginase-like protein (Ntn-hydrolase superfamily)